MGRRFAAAWWAALCAVLVCLCATAPPVRQAEYPPWDGAPYFDAGPDRVDVDTAPAAELETLPGIGESLARRIIAYREANGPFGSIEEIMEVSGIGEAKFAELEDRVTVDNGKGEVTNEDSGG